MKGRLSAWQISRAALSFGSVEHGFSVADRALRRFERMAEILKPLFGFSEIIVVFRPASQGQAPHSAKRPGEEVRVAGPVIASGGPIEWGAVVWGPERLSAERPIIHQVPHFAESCDPHSASAVSSRFASPRLDRRDDPCALPKHAFSDPAGSPRLRQRLVMLG